ncbi:hypothetical protein ACJIZ3_023821 [Penstemon smallii]|uniref:Uncharacterized protein n=1 Tax=Penstemon smallii TaxID=265156 RepID=A0ABD3TSG1_9LAMI
MQMEQLNLSPRISKTAPLFFFIFSLSSSWASVTPPLKSSCRRLAFSLSVIDSSHSIARIFSTRPPPPHPYSLDLLSPIERILYPTCWPIELELGDFDQDLRIKKRKRLIWVICHRKFVSR